MQVKTLSIKKSPVTFYAMAAMIAGVLYISRWIFEISEGIVKNKQYPPSFITQNFFVVKLLLIMALIGVYQQTQNKKMQWALLLACFGLVWTSVTRTLEAYGASGPWGFYSSPGVLLFFLGLITAGWSLIQSTATFSFGKVVLYITISYLLGCITSVLLFNLLGRNDAANQTASIVANLFFILEGTGWIGLGSILLKQHIRLAH